MNSISSVDRGQFRVLCLFVSVLVICAFQKIFTFHLSYWIYLHKNFNDMLLISFKYLNNRQCSLFNSDIGNSHFFLSLAKDLSFCLMFPKTQWILQHNFIPFNFLEAASCPRMPDAVVWVRADSILVGWSVLSSSFRSRLILSAVFHFSALPVHLFYGLLREDCGTQNSHYRLSIKFRQFWFVYFEVLLLSACVLGLLCLSDEISHFISYNIFLFEVYFFSDIAIPAFLELIVL